MAEAAPPQGLEITGPPHVFRCKMCRFVLFGEDEIVLHETVQRSGGKKMFRFQGFHEMQGEGGCTSYFLDPDITPWVSAESRQRHLEAVPCKNQRSVVDSDTIYCPRCVAKIGSQSWAGSQCSCGAWITPSFKIHAKAVDKLPCT
jgi:dual specificity phosphatase 12